jgi:hypothetical protein
MFEAEEQLYGISDWLDRHNADRDPEARTWGRLSKVAEEHGEVTKAWIAYTGQNPRKMSADGGPWLLREVEKESFDVALAALGNVAHLRHHYLDAGDNGVLEDFLAHIATVFMRAGLDK